MQFCMLYKKQDVLQDRARSTNNNYIIRNNLLKSE